MVLYEAYQLQRDITAPARAIAGLATWALGEMPESWTTNALIRQVSANFEMIERARLTHERPLFGLDQVRVGGVDKPVREEVVMTGAFSSLIHFTKEGADPQPPVLLVTALAGHFSTLLRGTARALLPDHDVYVTDSRTTPGTSASITAHSVSTTTSPN